MKPVMYVQEPPSIMAGGSTPMIDVDGSPLKLFSKNFQKRVDKGREEVVYYDSRLRRGTGKTVNSKKTSKKDEKKS